LLFAGWLNERGATKPAAQAHRLASQRCLTVWLVLGTFYLAFAIFSLLHTTTPAPNTDLSTLLSQNPSDYALSLGHFLDLNAQSLGLFRLPLILSALSLFFGPLIAILLRRKEPSYLRISIPLTILASRVVGKDWLQRWLSRKRRVLAANLTLFAAGFLFLLAAHLALQTFAPTLTSAQLAAAIAPQLHPDDLICIHGEYEAGSTLGFYLQRDDLHILDGRSSNLWYGSFFPDAPKIFETNESLAAKWASPQRVFLWQSLTDDPKELPPLSGPVYILVKSGGKEILSNQPNR
jgi:hypothetical protein